MFVNVGAGYVCLRVDEYAWRRKGRASQQPRLVFPHIKKEETKLFLFCIEGTLSEQANKLFVYLGWKKGY